ncbi:hypothetical protein EDC96DRAFT_277320 [Choanephora cucurbitarum]|nr:hypothetical protein EDC96DRAFT_277320 [Choanephora cucurbitarum]
MASANGVALDQYRLALFGVNMLVVDNLKHSMVFQVIGQSMKFYLCSLAGGICLMLEVGSLVLPTTYQEFASFSTSINCLYDIALLYDEHCVKEDASEARSWQLLAFDAFKSLFGISTCKTSTVASEALSSTERCL